MLARGDMLERLVMLKRFLKDEGGATAVEYGLIVAVLSLTIVGAISNSGNIVRENFIYLGTLITESTQQ